MILGLCRVERTACYFFESITEPEATGASASAGEGDAALPLRPLGRDVDVDGAGAGALEAEAGVGRLRQSSNTCLPPQYEQRLLSRRCWHSEGFSRPSRPSFSATPGGSGRVTDGDVGAVVGGLLFALDGDEAFSVEAFRLDFFPLP